jgi:hypothetical protein
MRLATKCVLVLTLGWALGLAGCQKDGDKMSADGGAKCKMCAEKGCVCADSMVKCKGCGKEMKAADMSMKCKCGTMKASAMMHKCEGCGKTCMVEGAKCSTCGQAMSTKDMMCSACAAKK